MTANTPIRLGLIAVLLASGSASAVEKPRYSAPITEPGRVNEYGDWSVACDNLLICTAASFSRNAERDDATGEQPELPLMTLWIGRKSDPLRPAIIMIDLTDYALQTEGDLALRVRLDDGDGPAYWLERREGFRYFLNAQDTLSFLEESRKSDQAIIGSPSGRILGRVSTKGMIAALRQMDATQGRAGSQTALIAKGPKAWQQLAPKPAKKWVYAMPQVSEIEFDHDYHPYGQDQFDRFCPQNSVKVTPQMHASRVVDGTKIWSVSCGNEDGPNPLRVWFAETPDGQSIPLGFRTPDNTAQGEVIRRVLPNAEFVPEIGGIRATYWLRESGDCGWKRTWVWTGAQFELSEAMDMPSCRGFAPELWFRTYEAAVGNLFDKRRAADQPATSGN